MAAPSPGRWSLTTLAWGLAATAFPAGASTAPFETENGSVLSFAMKETFETGKNLAGGLPSQSSEVEWRQASAVQREPFWVIDGTGCYVEGTCLASSRRRSQGKYGDNEGCKVQVADGTGPINVVEFSTEQNDDKLTVNHEEYDGNVGPDGIRPTGMIEWYSGNNSVTRTGWTICVPALTGEGDSAMPIRNGIAEEQDARTYAGLIHHDQQEYIHRLTQAADGTDDLVAKMPAEEELAVIGEAADAPGAAAHGRSLSEACVDDDSTQDRSGYGCDEYIRYPFTCGYYDDGDFTSSAQCCICGGGRSQAYPDLLIASLCSTEEEKNGKYVNKGLTASGAPYYSNERGAYLYYDPDCNGQSQTPRWILDEQNPDTSSANDLDSDGSCNYIARVDSSWLTDGLPLGAQTWRVYCDGEWIDSTLNIQIAEACVDDDSTQDNAGDGCDWYADNTDDCGSFDDDDFTSSYHCCICIDSDVGSQAFSTLTLKCWTLEPSITSTGTLATIEQHFKNADPSMTSEVRSIDSNSGFFPYGLSDYFGCMVTGNFSVPTSGNATFYSSSDDGSMVYIDDVAVVNNDGLHGTQQRSGVIDLTAGIVYRFKATFFEDGAGNTWRIRWTPPGWTSPDVFTSPTLVGHDLFKALWGTGCYFDGACLASSRRRDRGNYGNNERCMVQVADGTGPITVVDFFTEQNYDKLTVSDEEYDGSVGPDGVRPIGLIEWYSDYIYTKTGWTICMPALTGSATPISNRTAEATAQVRMVTGALTGGHRTFDYSDNMVNQEIARLACEAEYETGNCVVGSCGRFRYYYRAGSLSCNCDKKAGELEWIFENEGHQFVSEDYSAQDGGDKMGLDSLFVRERRYEHCQTTSWRLALAQLGSARLPIHHQHPWPGWQPLRVCGTLSRGVGARAVSSE